MQEAFALIEKHGSNLQPLISEINSVDLSADETALQPSSDEILELEKKCEDIANYSWKV